MWNGLGVGSLWATLKKFVRHFDITSNMWRQWKMNEINRLWDKWAKDHSDADVDEIIAYYRKQLAMYDAGVKPKRAEAEQIDMNKILDNIRQKQGSKPAPKPVAKGKGLRRI